MSRENPPLVPRWWTCGFPRQTKKFFEKETIPSLFFFVFFFPSTRILDLMSRVPTTPPWFCPVLLFETPIRPPRELDQLVIFGRSSLFDFILTPLVEATPSFRSQPSTVSPQTPSLIAPQPSFTQPPRFVPAWPKFSV